MTTPRTPPINVRDLRAAPRVVVRLSAEVIHDERLFTATTRDLSLGGVCLETVHVVPEGISIRVGLFLVDDDVEDASQPPFEVQGTVAWNAPGEDGHPGAMGIRFEGVSAEQQEGLTRFLKMFPQAG